MGDVQAVSVALTPRPAPARSKRVVLVRPTTLTAKFAYTAPTCPPLALAYLAGTLVADGHEVEVVDAIGEALTQFLPAEDPGYVTHGLTPQQLVERVAPDTEVIGVSCMFSHDWPMARTVIDALRARCPQALIVAGGEHVTAVPDESLLDCPSLDVAVLGEGEETLSELANCDRDPEQLARVRGIVYRTGNGEMARTEARTRIRAVDDIPPPAWDLVPLEAYLAGHHGFGVYRGRSLPVLATRGCPYQCTFCSSPTMWTTRYVVRSPADVLAEIRAGMEQYKVTNIDFYDLTMIVRRSWIIEFCNLVIDSGLKFSWQLPSGTRSEVLDEEVIKLLYAAGLRNMSYAPESGSADVLKRVKKRVDLERMKNSMRVAVRNGINIKANIMIGLPDETRREVFQTFRFIVETALLGLHDLTVTPFSPYPGSELFDELRAKGLIPEHLDDDYYLNLSYSDLSSVDSWSDNMGSRELAVYRIVGMVAFYFVSYVRRPWRLVELLRRIFFEDTEESRLEQGLKDMLSHFRTGQAAEAR